MSEDREVSEKDVGRLNVTLPNETIENITKWAAAAGVKRGQYVSMSLAIGARILARQVVPEAFFTAETWRSLAEAMGVDAASLQEALETGKVKQKL